MVTEKQAGHDKTRVAFVLVSFKEDSNDTRMMMSMEQDLVLVPVMHWGVLALEGNSSDA